ncbi:protein CPR-5-like isoform X2 [Musa acuminata AAA Group]|uniref:protein CPR-5-like isoform X2 n=1 Tax=Musa acuminata AAA Group TaxID=214697 RepID=UPI0031E04450
MECARSNGSAAVDGGDGEGGRGRAGGRVDCATVRMRRWQPLERGRGVSSSRTRSTERDDASSSSSSSSRQRTQRTGMRLRNRHRSLWAPRVGRGNEGLEDLALPLGMSFAAVVAQILNGKNISGRRSQINHFSMICTSAVKESITNTRSNDLKAVEIGLVMEKLKLKQSQLALSSDANLLEKIKISMGISKASFKEEKLRNQMLETRHAELLKRCIDLLVTGLIIMCGFLLYGASIYSLQRITEVTSACNYTLKESRSWWIPKSVQSFSSGWLTLRCHFVVLTRMCFGILMILAIAYLVFQRSAMSGPTMPVTFLVMLLGVVCGFAGKLCVDTLGGSGYHWLIYWEVLCMLHFFANVFPSAFHNILYGPVAVTQVANTVRLPYWVRRYAFYILLLLILPTLSGLLPFASIKEWKVHFSEKLAFWSSGIGYEETFGIIYGP